MKTKNTILFTVLFLITLYFISCSSNTGSNRLGLRGDVSVVEESLYAVANNFGEVSKGELIDTETKIFDKEGNCIEEVEYDKYGNLESKYINKFDNNHNCIARMRYGSNGKLEKKDEHKYNTEGKLIEHIELLHDYYYGTYSLYGKTLRNYDNDGNCVQKHYIENGKMTQKQTFKYDDYDNCIEQNIYFSNGELTIAHINKYDTKGNCIEMIQKLKCYLNTISMVMK